MSFWKWLFGRAESPTGVDTPTADSGDGELDDYSAPDPDPIELEITDVLDLHSFPPRDVNDVVRGYLDEAYDRGLRSVRIIHGRGVGVQRKAVRTILDRDHRVVSFEDAPPEAGGWGATVVELE